MEHSLKQRLSVPVTKSSGDRRPPAGRRARWLTTLLVCSLVAPACGASSDSTPAAVVAVATKAPEAADPIVEATATPESTAAPEPGATVLPTPTPLPTPTLVPMATATPPPATSPEPADVTSEEFERRWDVAVGMVGTVFPDVPAPPSLPSLAPGTYGGLELRSYSITEGILLATSFDDDYIDGYVLLFDPDSLEAVQSVIVLGSTVSEIEVVDRILDGLEAPAQLQDFAGVGYRFELFRSGADPVNDPLFLLTMLPNDSLVDHEALRRAGTEAAIATL